MATPFGVGGGLLLLLLGSVLVMVVQSVTQMCNPSQSKVVYQFSVDACPFGILFALPLKTGCLRSSSDNDVTTFYADICENIKYDPDSSKQIQLITTLTDGPLSEMDSCLGNQTFQCDVELKEVNRTELTEPGQDPIFADEENLDEPEDIAVLRNDSSIVEQTMRMFKFLVGLEGVEGGHAIGHPKFEGDKDKNETLEGPILRITQLLTQSFHVVSKHCNVRYVPAEFGRDVRRMFLFLLREGTIGRLEDVSREDFERIKTALDHCMEQQSAFILKGPACETHANAHYVEKNGTTMPYIPDEFSYIPYKYDVVIDATWSIMDFTHGLCYGTFRDHINSHHLYQRAIERLFNEPIVFRWPRPPHLNNEEIWDKMLSTNTRETMRNLDVCIQGAYLDTPFNHRLERPLIHFDGGATPAPGGDGGAAPAPAPDPAPPTRRKRGAKSQPPKSLESDNSELDEDTADSSTIKPAMLAIPAATLTLDEIGLSEAGWCFQTEEEQRKGVLNYIGTTCPGSLALEQFSQTPPSNSTTEEETIIDYKEDEADKEQVSSSQPPPSGDHDSGDGSTTSPEKEDSVTPQPADK